MRQLAAGYCGIAAKSEETLASRQCASPSVLHKLKIEKFNTNDFYTFVLKKQDYKLDTFTQCASPLRQCASHPTP